MDAESSITPFVYNSVPVRRDEHDFLNITDMHKAAGSDPSKKPADWLRSKGAKNFIQYQGEIHAMRNSHSALVRAEAGGKGGGGGTWAHWKVAFVYAEYLSPEFHDWCITVVRAVMEGKSTCALAPSPEPVALAPVPPHQIMLKVGTLLAEIQRALGGFVLQMEKVTLEVEANVVEQTHLMLREMEERIGERMDARFEQARALVPVVQVPVLAPASVLVATLVPGAPIGYEQGMRLNQRMTGLARQRALRMGKPVPSMRGQLDSLLRRRVNHAKCWHELEADRLPMVDAFFNEVEREV